MHLPTLITIASLTGAALAGINCKGSQRCDGVWSSQRTNWHSNVHHAQSLFELMLTLPAGSFIPNYQKIACTRDICAYLQGTKGLPADVVVQMALEIVDHECERCGHCPVGYPDNNSSDKDGMLVFDWVNNACLRHGVCPDFQAQPGNVTIRDVFNTKVQQQEDEGCSFKQFITGHWSDC